MTKEEFDALVDEVMEDLIEMYRNYHYTTLMEYLRIPEPPERAIPFFCFCFFIWQLNDEKEAPRINSKFRIRA
jgi:hypothetical protein